MADNYYSIWDKLHISMILSRTKLAKDTIFFGDKEITFNKLFHLLKNGHMDTIYG